MSEKRFFTKVNKTGRLVIIDKECHIELIDLTLACDVLNRLNLKLKTYNEQLGEQQSTISQLRGKNEQLQKENTFLVKQRNYWKSKFDEGTETFDGKALGKTKELEKENELLKQTNEKLAIENANLEQSIKFLNNKINTLKETNLTLVKEIRKLPLTDKQFKEMNDEL